MLIKIQGLIYILGFVLIGKMGHSMERFSFSRVIVITICYCKVEDRLVTYAPVFMIITPPGMALCSAWTKETCFTYTLSRCC